ncbi:MAG: hypothetical protein ACOC56_07020 [Atribacterota bacterium]
MYLKVSDCYPYGEYLVIDVNTNMPIPGVQEANDETGEFSVHLRDSNGFIIFNKDLDKVALFKFKGNIKLVKKEEYYNKKESD